MNLMSNAVLPKKNFSLKNNSQSLSNSTYEIFRKLIYENCGIYFQDNKKYLLESRLLKRLNFLGLNSFENYFDYLKYNINKEQEKKYLYEVITINETFFFRNQPQLNALVSKIIPDIIASKKNFGNPKLKIWSAASSSGEEAYSVAMTIKDLVKPKYPNLLVEIIGTDISQAVIDTAKSGIYREYSIRNTPTYYLKKFFTVNNNNFEIKQDIKDMVSFKILNLFDDKSMRAMTNFDIVFCANVLIYFDSNSKIKVISNIYNSLNKGGCLFIGYAETLHAVSKAFSIVSFPKTIGYKKE